MTIKESSSSRVIKLEQTIEELEKRIMHLEQSAHTEHTLGAEAVDQLVKQVISRIGNGLTSLVQRTEE